MNCVLRLSVALYRTLVRLYPAEFRQRWGAEMVDTFGMQIHDAAAEGGWTAVIGTWSSAVAEFLRIALPLQLTRTSVVVPVVSLAVSSAVFFGEIWVLENPLALRAAWRHLVTQFGG